MKLDINEIGLIPPKIAEKVGDGFCVFKVNEKIQAWIDFHGFETSELGPFTNIFIPDGTKLSDILSYPEGKPHFDWMDGFSPNLNKHLHIGHLANLVTAKAIYSLGLVDKVFSILGDTLEGEVEKKDAMSKFVYYTELFGYVPHKILFASEAKLGECDESLSMECKSDKCDGCQYSLVEGTGEYADTKVFDVPEYGPIVGIKSDGSTTYFYQDMAVAEKLNAPTLYITGDEQSEHFAKLKKYYPQVEHLGMGLVLANGKKMSSREGNVIYVDDLMDMLLKEFNSDHKLAYNIFAGQILKSAPGSTKNIDMKQLSNPKNSAALHMSYAVAALKSAGCEVKNVDTFNSVKLQFAEMMSVNDKTPHHLFKEMMGHSKKIMSLYQTHHIVGNEENKLMFEVLLSDLLLGFKKLGLFEIEKV